MPLSGSIVMPLAPHIPWWIWTILASIAAAFAGAFWARAQHRRAQRHANRILHSLSESITAAASQAEIAAHLGQLLPSVSRATTARLFVHSHATKSLNYVPTPDDPDPMAINVEAPPEGLARGLVKCFLGRATVHIPDVRRNPLVSAGWQPGVARSVMFVPLLAQQDHVGVLEVSSTRRVGYFSREDQAAVQHLSNQIAASLKLQEQHAVREQLFRSEKLAASAQLISGVAGELSEPLGDILNMAEKLENEKGHDTPPEVHKIAVECRRAADILARLISFAHSDTETVKAVDVTALIAGLVEFRESEWKTRGLRVQNRLTTEPALALGSRGQLEQLFLNLLVHAEQNAANATDHSLSLSSARMAGKIVVEIHYASETPRASVAETPDAPGLDVCRAIAASHGGEIRVVSRSSSAGFEVDLPLMPVDDPRTAASGPRKSARAMTLLVVDSDAAAQRQLVGMLSARGHRVIPVPAEQAADLAPRMRFDGVFWAVRSGGPKWGDQQDRIRPAVPAFVLLSDGYDRDLASSLEDSGGYLLARPLQASELDRVLDAVDVRTAVRTPA